MQSMQPMQINSAATEWRNVLNSSGLDDRPPGFVFPSDIPVRALYEYWHYGMGTAARYDLPLKKLNSKWSRAELKSRAQARTLVEYFDAVLSVSSYASSNSPSERERPFKEAYDSLISAMSKYDFKPRNPDIITYPSFYEHYLIPFLNRLETVAHLSGNPENKGTRGKKRCISSFLNDIKQLF